MSTIVVDDGSRITVWPDPWPGIASVHLRVDSDRPLLLSVSDAHALAAELVAAARRAARPERGSFSTPPVIPPVELADGADSVCGCRETYPQLVPGRISHHPGCSYGR